MQDITLENEAVLWLRDVIQLFEIDLNEIAVIEKLQNFLSYLTMENLYG